MSGFEFRPAARENVHLLIGLAGASGAGKTKSALELAVGLVGGNESRIAMVDTEARRGLHYARRPGATDAEEPGKYGFHHADMLPPFRPDRIIEAVEAAENAEMGVLIIDSMSHEYDGEDGISDWAADIEAGGTKSPGNWKIPKLAHKKMMNRLLTARCHIVFCLRAEEKIKIFKRDDLLPDGSIAEKTVIWPMGWMPICEKRFMFEMTTSFTLRPDNPGKPQFDLPHKLQDQHRPFFPPDEFITREAGRRLAEWASGAKPAGQADLSPVDLYAREVGKRIKAATTAEVLTEWWKSTAAEREHLSIPTDRLSAMAAAVTKRVTELKANPGQQEESTQ